MFWRSRKRKVPSVMELKAVVITIRSCPNLCFSLIPLLSVLITYFMIQVLLGD